MNCENCKNWTYWGVDYESKARLGMCKLSGETLFIYTQNEDINKNDSLILFPSDFGCINFRLHKDAPITKHKF